MAEPARKLDKDDSKPARQSAWESWGVQPSAIRGYAQAGSDNKKLSPDELKRRESGTKANQRTAPERDESDQVGRGYKPSSAQSTKHKKRFRVSGKTAAGGGIVGLIAGGAVSIIGIMHGPLSAIHFSQLLQQIHLTPNIDFVDTQTARIIWYARSGQGARSRLGVVGNAYADRLERRLQRRTGLASVYDGRSGRFLGYEIRDPLRAERYVQQLRAEGIPLDNNLSSNAPRDFQGNPPRAGNQIIRLENVSTALKKKAIRITLRTQIPAKFPAGVSARTLYARAGLNLKPLGNRVMQAGERFDDFVKQRRDERVQRRVGNTEGIRTHIQQSDSEADQIIQDSIEAETPEARAGISARLGTAVRVGGTIDAALGLACAIRAVGQEIPNYQYANQVLPTLRFAAEIISAGDQIAAAGIIHDEEGDSTVVNAQGADDPVIDDTTGADTNSNQLVSMDEIGAFTHDFNQEVLDDEGNPTGEVVNFSAARSFQAELGRPLTGPDMPDGAKLSRAGETPFFFQAFDTVVRRTTGGSDSLAVVCPVYDFLGRFRIISNFLGDLSDAILNATIGYDTGDLVSGLISWSAGGGLCGMPQGADAGNCANFGARLFASDHMVALGGRELSDAEEADVKTAARELLEYEQSQKSFATRMFDVTDAHSVAATAVRNMPRSPSQAVASFLRSPARLFSSIFTPASAQQSQFCSENDPREQTGECFSYGFPRYGYSLEEQNDPRFENPYENAEIVEPQLDELNERYGDCFGMRVVRRGDSLGLQINDQEKPAQILAYAPPIEGSTADCPTGAVQGAQTGGEVLQSATGEPGDFLRYRFYLAHTISALSIACYEGGDQACNEIYGGAAASGAQQGPVSSIDGLVQGDTQAIAQQLLNSPNVTLRDETRNQVQAVANGGDGIDPMVIRVLATLGERHTFTVSSIRRCTSGIGAGTRSRHCTGHAADISGSAGIDGSGPYDFFGQNPQVQTFLDSVAAIMPSGSEIGVPNSLYESSTIPKVQDNVEVLVDNRDTTGATGAHIHLGVPR